MCGEEPTRRTRCARTSEIPPRVRRRGFDSSLSDSLLGNTSACAEKSPDGDSAPHRAWKYLRVCGEESRSPPRSMPSTEIPPRVRRRAAIETPYRASLGNTSACAEKRAGRGCRSIRLGKYLRVCGEERRRWGMSLAGVEIPPRVRRRARDREEERHRDGNTSACAEKSQGRNLT